MQASTSSIHFRMLSIFSVLVALMFLSFSSQTMKAQSLGFEGPTGIFVTPLAYTAASPANNVGRPVVAYHFVSAGPVLGEFNTFSVTQGMYKYLEIGYTGNLHVAGDNATFSPLWTRGFNILHGKVTVVPENYGKHKWVPAIAIGGIGRFGVKNVGGELSGHSTNNGDVYIVGTKIVPLAKPVALVLNFGYRGTNSSLWGLGGNAPDFTGRLFGAAGFAITGPKKSSVILASEFQQQPQRLQGIPTLDIPTTIVYAARVVPFAKHKLNLDFGILEAADKVAPGVGLQARNRFAFGISYGF